MPSLLVSTSGVTPSDLKIEKVVPAGNVLEVTTTLKMSLPLPLLVITLVKVTVPPWTADATSWMSLAVLSLSPVAVVPVSLMVTAALCFTLREPSAGEPSAVSSVFRKRWK